MAGLAKEKDMLGHIGQDDGDHGQAGDMGNVAMLRCPVGECLNSCQTKCWFARHVKECHLKVIQVPSFDKPITDRKWLRERLERWEKNLENMTEGELRIA